MIDVGNPNVFRTPVKRIRWGTTQNNKFIPCKDIVSLGGEGNVRRVYRFVSIRRKKSFEREESKGKEVEKGF